MLGQILTTFILVVVGVSLVPSVANTAYDAKFINNGSGTRIASNVTGTSGTLIDLIPLFFIIGLVVTTIQSSVAVLARMGL